MKKVAVFGKPGGGKSTFSKRLASVTELELFPLDTIEYLEGGVRVSQAEFNDKHNAILNKDQWVVDGLGSLESFKQRLEAADTLVYIKLPTYQHLWFVTKRYLKHPWQAPEGYPKKSPMLRSTLTSFLYLAYSNRFWTKDFEQHLKKMSNEKTVVFLNSLNDMESFFETLKSSRSTSS